jgi:hypothetical protein
MSSAQPIKSLRSFRSHSPSLDATKVGTAAFRTEGMLLFEGGGGEGGIRTHDTVARTPHFECGTFNHSATSPSGQNAGSGTPRRGQVIRESRSGNKRCRDRTPIRPAFARRATSPEGEVWHRACGHRRSLLAGRPVGKPRIAEPGPDRQHTPMLDVAHVGHFAEALHHRVIVHQDGHVVIADRGDRLGEPCR